MRELHLSFKRGTLTEERIIEEMFSYLGGSLYAYTVMLSTLGRKQESDLMEDLRTIIFSTRGNWIKDINVAIGYMDRIVIEMGIIKQMLEIYRPDESILFQSPVNFAHGLRGALADYKIEKNL